ncbi:hypothetical protein AX16_000251 [Volvariella volvacea WC 439]|nr:hypothetical protein AX16_000251 [Volvariella volvacea WC 439]
MSNRIRGRDDVETAYEIQSRAAITGLLRGVSLGAGVAMMAHYSWPLFRRQTLAFKAFLVSGCGMIGLTFAAENALLAHEAQRRREENYIRREARLDLARQGLIGTETEIAKWRAERERKIAGEE